MGPLVLVLAALGGGLGVGIGATYVLTRPTGPLSEAARIMRQIADLTHRAEKASEVGRHGIAEQYNDLASRLLERFNRL